MDARLRLRRIIALQLALAVVMSSVAAVGAPERAEAVTAAFTNPVADVWDPSMVTHDGSYYLTGTSLDNNLRVSSATSIGSLRNATPTVVWTGPTSGLGCCRLWSPTMTEIDGKWWIHLTVTNADATSAAVYALEGTTADPLGPYTLKGVVKSWNTGDPHYWERALVGPSITVMPDGKMYLATSTFGFYIQELENPWTLKAGSSLVTIDDGSKSLDWEGGSSEISRPFVKTVNGQTKVFVPYSSENHVTHANNGGPCWSWCTGMFINTDGNLTNPGSWTKAQQPVFAGGPDSGLYRSSGLSTFKSPDGTEDWVAFHGNDAPGTDFGERDTAAQRFTFDANGYPDFGTPAALGTALTAPSGDTNTPAAILPGDVLLNETFSSGASAWTAHTGSWSVVNGAYQAGSGDSIATAGEARWANYTAQAKVTASSQPNGSGVNLLVRAGGPNDFLVLELLRDGAGVEKWIINARIAGVYYILASGLYDWNPNQPYWLRLAVNEGTLAALISTDGVSFSQLSTFRFPGSQPPRSIGTVGLRSWGGAAAAFDDVKVVASRTSYGFYTGVGWPGMTIDAGVNQPNPNEGYCENASSEYCLGGLTASTTSPIATDGVANALPGSFYQTERWNDAQPSTRTDDGSFRYAIPSLQPGAGYVIRLHFAEIYWNEANKRRFDVRINGTLVLDEFDKFAAAGGKNEAVVREFRAVADAYGHVMIEFLPGQSPGDVNPTVSAIQVLPEGRRLDIGSASGVGWFAPDPLGTSPHVRSVTTAISTNGVGGAAPAAVYQTERYSFGSPGDFHVIVSNLAPNGTYLVRLHFAETYWSSPNQRAFNVDVQGTRRFTNLDIVTQAGAANKALVRDVTATASAGGNLDVHLTQGSVPGVDGNPLLQGIEVLSPWP